MIEPREQPDGTLYLYSDDPGRQQLYDQLIASRLETSVAGQESLEAIMTMGAPGSGKSFVLDALGLCQSDVVLVDPDLIKTDLVEYHVGRAAHDRLAADRVHRESSTLAKRLRDEAIGSRRDLCIDGVMSRKDAAIEVIQRLQSNGYEVTVVAAVVPFDVSYQRVLSRGEETGRFVPYDFAQQAHENIEQHRDEILRIADRGYAFNTNVSIDEQPVLIVHYENGEPVAMRQKPEQPPVRGNL
jgi:predicted ABC-type ATPase